MTNDKLARVEKSDMWEGEYNIKIGRWYSCADKLPQIEEEIEEINQAALSWSLAREKAAVRKALEMVAKRVCCLCAEGVRLGIGGGLCFHYDGNISKPCDAIRIQEFIAKIDSGETKLDEGAKP